MPSITCAGCPEASCSLNLSSLVETELAKELEFETVAPGAAGVARKITAIQRDLVVAISQSSRSFLFFSFIEK